MPSKEFDKFEKQLFENQDKISRDTDSERKMFGETIKDMLKAKPEIVPDGMYAMMILSDVQEILIDNPDRARQWINKAKYFIRRAEKSRMEGLNVKNDK